MFQTDFRQKSHEISSIKCGQVFIQYGPIEYSWKKSQKLKMFKWNFQKKVI